MSFGLFLPIFKPFDFKYSIIFSNFFFSMIKKSSMVPCTHYTLPHAKGEPQIGGRESDPFYSLELMRDKHLAKAIVPNCNCDTIP